MIDHGLQTSIILFGRVQEESRKSPEERGYRKENSAFGWMSDVGYLQTELRTAIWQHALRPEICTPRDVFNVAIKVATCSLTIAEIYLVEGGLSEGLMTLAPDPDPLSVSREKLR